MAKVEVEAEKMAQAENVVVHLAVNKNTEQWGCLVKQPHFFILKIIMRKINCQNKIEAYLEKTESKLCGFSVWFKIGSAYDKKDKQGLAHLVEHLKFTNGKEFEKIGMTMHAFTSIDYIEITGSFLSHNYKECLNYLVETINSKLDIKPKELEKEIETILNEKKEVSGNVYQQMWQTRNTQLWKDGPLSSNFFGTKETLKNITPKDLEDFNKKYIQNNQSMSLFFYGDIKEIELQKILTKISANNIQYKKPENPKTKNPIYNKTKKFTSNAIGVHLKIEKINLKDIAKLNLLREILANNWSSIFVEKMRLNKNQTYWVESSSKTLLEDAYISIYFEPKSKNLTEVVKDITNTLLNIKPFITEERLQAVKNSYMLRILSNNHSPEDICYWYGESYTKEDTISSPFQYVEKIEKITIIEINQFIEKTITPTQIYSTIFKK